jgi:hypothetical protein
MDSRTVRLKFGRNYVADERTFMMGIDQRFTTSKLPACSSHLHHFRKRLGCCWQADFQAVQNSLQGYGQTPVTLASLARVP